MTAASRISSEIANLGCVGMAGRCDGESRFNGEGGGGIFLNGKGERSFFWADMRFKRMRVRRIMMFHINTRRFIIFCAAPPFRISHF